MSVGNAAIARRASDEQLLIYKIYRERVSQEDQLVNHRMGWMLWSNAILFGFFVGLAAPLSGKDSINQIRYLSNAPILIILTGIVCTAGCIFAIQAALGEIEHLRMIYYERYPDIREAELKGLMPRLVGHRGFHLVGKVVPWVIPVTIILLWLSLFALEVFQLR